MGSTFVRVTVFADDRQLDVSLPAQRPIVDFLPDIASLLDTELAPDPASWALSSPVTGPLDPMDTLAEASVLDGATVDLTRTEGAAAPPFVDDVLAEMNRSVDRGYARWHGRPRALWLGVIASMLQLVATATLLVAGGDVASGAGACVLALLALGVGMSTRSGPGQPIAWTAAPAAGVAVWRLAGSAAVAPRLALTLAAIAFAVALASAALGHLRSFVGLGVVVGTVLAACSGVFLLKGNAVALSAWGTIALLVVLLLTPRMALASSGLLAQLRKAERLELSARSDVDAALNRGRTTVDILVWSTAGLGLLAAVVIAETGVWQQGLLSVAFGLVLLLRSRSFAHARHVGPVVAAGVGALAASVHRLPYWIGLDSTVAVIVWSVGAAVLIGALVVGAATTLDEVPSAQLRRLFDGLDLPICLAFVPVVVFAQGIYPYFWPS